MFHKPISHQLDVSSVRTIAGGLVDGLVIDGCQATPHTLGSEVFLLSTDRGHLVLKANRETKAIAKENNVYELLRDTDISAPVILACDTSGALFSIGYLLMTACRGHNVQDIFETLSIQNRNDLFKSMGATLAKVHQVRGMAYGEVSVSSDATKGKFSSWKSFHLSLVDERLQVISEGPFHDLCGSVRNFFETSQILEGLAPNPKLIHLDFHMKNIFVDPPSVVSEVIDWESACFGDAEEDLMRAQLALFDGDKTLTDAFLSGYQTVGVLDAGYEGRKDFYRLSRSLVHAGCLVRFGENYAGDKLAQEIQVTREHITRLIGA